MHWKDHPLDRPDDEVSQRHCRECGTAIPHEGICEDCAEKQIEQSEDKDRIEGGSPALDDTS